ncbi:MAG: hypothetical protein U9Q63_02480 [Patescibacteria group bacterium]|nr:hypothetical protein [Patescibacteria group bacterium]
MTKLQITLTDQEAMALGYGASNLGYSLTKFVKFLLGQKAVEWNKNIPSYQLSKKAVEGLEKSMKDYKDGKFTEVKSLMELVD